MEENFWIGVINMKLEFVLPEADHLPSHVSELSMIPFVPLPVFRNFLLPRIGYFMLPGWKSIPVPEISIQENGDSGSTEDDVRPAGKLFDMLPES
jgi:hypothetical protein